MSPPAPEKHFGVRFYFQAELCLDIQRTQVHTRQSIWHEFWHPHTKCGVFHSIPRTAAGPHRVTASTSVLFHRQFATLYPQHLLAVPCQILSSSLNSEDRGCQTKHKSPSHLKLQVSTLSRLEART